jgi:hypothetical protein
MCNTLFECKIVSVLPRWERGCSIIYTQQMLYTSFWDGEKSALSLGGWCLFSSVSSIESHGIIKREL